MWPSSARANWSEIEKHTFHTLKPPVSVSHTCTFYISSMKAQSQSLPEAGSVIHQSLKSCSSLSLCVRYWTLTWSVPNNLGKLEMNVHIVPSLKVVFHKVAWKYNSVHPCHLTAHDWRCIFKCPLFFESGSAWLVLVC